MEKDQYQTLLDCAQVGWWETDFKAGCYICSGFLVSLLGLETPRLPIAEFFTMIREDYRTRITTEFSFFKEIGIYEQIFPIKTCYGYRFVRSKIYKREIGANGDIKVYGILQLISFSEEETDGLVGNRQVDNLLRHLGGLSRSLHSFIQTNDLHQSIHLALTEILYSIYTKGRAYIMEYENERTLSCTHEVCSEGVTPAHDTLQKIPLTKLPWSTKKIQKLYPVMINNLDELPLEAAEEKYYLEKRGVRSLIMIPLIIKGTSWGYMGIDIVDNNRMWSLEDYQWLSSISNIISIITKMARINEALDHSEKLLRNIYTNIPVGIELYDKNGYLVDMNNMDVEIFGVPSKEAALGINIFDNPMLPEEVIEKLRDQEPVSFRLNYSFNQVKREDYYLTAKEGSLDILTKANMLYDTNGDLINYLLINLDNTDKTIAYNRIEEFEHFFSLVSRFAKVGYAKFDLLSREGSAIDQWYQNLGEIEGTPLPQVIGVYSSVHPEDQKVMIDFFERVKQGETSGIRKELRIKNGEGWKWTRVNVMRNMQSVDPDKLEMICVNYDITELKETQKQREKAEELDRLKSAFLANMSHEIRTPLNAIVGFSTLLIETKEPEERAQFVKIIQKNNELLLQLISDVLDLAKIESGIIELKPIEVDLRELCKELIVSMRIKVSAEVALCLAPDLPFYTLVCDKVRLTQVISNFINNAIKHTCKGAIVLSYQVLSDEIEFSVTDTGDGMSQEVQQHVFDRFYKGNSFKQGTGLGLSICKSIIEQLGGRIGVKSEESKGSCFWFTLPR